MSKLIVIIKPWSIQHTDNILTELDKYGTRLQTTKIEQIKLEDIALHYIAHKQRINYQDMIQDFEGLTLTLALYEGDYTTLNKLKKEIREKYSHDYKRACIYYLRALFLIVLLLKLIGKTTF